LDIVSGVQRAVSVGVLLCVNCSIIERLSGAGEVMVVSGGRGGRFISCGGVVGLVWLVALA